MTINSSLYCTVLLHPATIKLYIIFSSYNSVKKNYKKGNTVVNNASF